jgi:hypothetical protein
LSEILRAAINISTDQVGIMVFKINRWTLCVSQGSDRETLARIARSDSRYAQSYPLVTHWERDNNPRACDVPQAPVSDGKGLAVKQ